MVFKARPGLRGNPAPESEVTSSIPDTAIKSKVVGTTFAKDGQALLAQFHREGVLAFEGSGKKFQLVLRSEPDNPHDGEAVAVYAQNILTRNEVRLGYISNNERLCPTCDADFAKVIQASQAVRVCACGTDTIRNGLATKLTQSARARGLDVEDCYSVVIAWESGGITGGGRTTQGGTKNWGCNISIISK